LGLGAGGRHMGNNARMDKLPRESLERVRAVEDALAHYSLDGDNVQASLEALHALLGTDKLLLYSLAQRSGGEDLMVAHEANVAYPAALWRSVFDDFLRGRGVDWGPYNALKPDRAQRDRVLKSDEIAEITGGRSREVEQSLYARLGMFGEDTMRVLVCDGPSMLAWLGCVQPERTTKRQREILERVVPAFRKRLVFERFLREASLASSALAASLEAVNGAAWVLAPDGRIAHANSAGRARYDEDPTRTRSALEVCVAGVADPRLRAMPLREGDSGLGHVVVELPDPASATFGVGTAAQRFRLTPAQTRVLERVARGISNATIAAELGVAERTIEAHVTAILVKAQVPSRAALIVQIFRGA
jgi:DNA-binding CsgD family transcriptional regulator/PAS domain-containing protein